MLTPREATEAPTQLSRSPLSPTEVTELATVRLFLILSALLCSLRPGFCIVCDFAHARPIMLQHSTSIGASVSEPPLVDSTDALSRYIYRRAYVHRYCACAALRANVAGQIWNRFSPAESAFSACIGIESDQLSQHYDDHLGLKLRGDALFRHLQGS